jgi:hypothetical protein
LSARIEKLKAVLLNHAATNEQKSKAIIGLVAAGISPVIVKSWARQGAANPGIDERTRIAQPKWILSQPSTAATKRKEVIEELLTLGISSKVIQEWARRRFK